MQRRLAVVALRGGVRPLFQQHLHLRSVSLLLRKFEACHFCNTTGHLYCTNVYQIYHRDCLVSRTFEIFRLRVEKFEAIAYNHPNRQRRGAASGRRSSARKRPPPSPAAVSPRKRVALKRTAAELHFTAQICVVNSLLLPKFVPNLPQERSCFENIRVRIEKFEAGA